MFWSPADLKGTESVWDNIARHDVIVAGIDTFGFAWKPARHHAMVETIDAGTITPGRRNVARLFAKNPAAVLLLEVYFFEEEKDGYPRDHRWWLRDKNGRRKQFWPGNYMMNLADAGYVAHVARRIAALHKAAGRRTGIFLDNLRTDPASKAAWISLLKLVRKLCGEDMPIQVNAGWQSEDIAWIAPYVNGIAYEDAVHHATNKDTEAFYGRIRKWEALCRTPHISANEVYGKRRDAKTRRREFIRTLVYTNMAFLYADSTRGHRHGWYGPWDISLGKALAGPRSPAEGKLAKRRFEKGLVLWLPASAKKDETVRIGRKMRDAFSGRYVRSVTLTPGKGALLLDKPFATQSVSEPAGSTPTGG